MSKQIHIIVSTHQGRLYDEHCDYIGVMTKDGEFGILPDHIPVITSFDEGYVKLVRGNDSVFISLCSSAIEFSENEMVVLAQEAFVGKTMESARKHLDEVRKDRLEQNRKLDADLTLQEKKMIDNIKKSKAGKI